MALTLSGTNGVVGAGFTLDPSGTSVTAGVGTFGSIKSDGIVQIGGATENSADIDATNTKVTIKQSANAAEDGIYIERFGERRGHYIYVGSGLSQNDALCVRSQQLGTDTDVLAIDRGGDVVIGAGNLVIATSGKGIDFSATGDGSGSMGSELLDDYEEGTFTPVVADSSTGGNTASSYTTSIGWYTKIGNLVNIQMRIRDINQGSISNSSVIYIRGFPYAMEQRSNALVVGHCETSDFNTPSNCHGVSTLTNNGSSNPTWCRLFAQIDNATHGVQNFDSIGTTNQIQINMSYRVA